MDVDQGLAWGLLVAGVGGLVALARQFAAWASPRVDKIVDAHVGLVETLKANDERQTTNSERQTQILEEHTAMLSAIRAQTQPGASSE